MKSLSIIKTQVAGLVFLLKNFNKAKVSNENKIPAIIANEILP